MNNFVSRQSQCTRWRRKSKEGKTKRRSQNLISLSLRKNPSRNHRRKRLRLTSSLWRALGRWPQFWRLKETCCILLLYLWFVRLESMVEILLFLLLVVTQRPEWYNVCCPDMHTLYFWNFVWMWFTSHLYRLSNNKCIVHGWDDRMKSCLLLIILHTNCVVSLSGVACVACCVAVPFVRWDSSNFTWLLVQLFVLSSIECWCDATIIWIILLRAYLVLKIFQDSVTLNF